MKRGTLRLGGRRRLVGIGGFALTAALVVFHGGLLWQRLADGSLLQPLVVTRWGASLALAVALFQLWSRGLPVLRGRRAGVIWLIVALLHAFVPGAPLPAVEPVAAGMAALALLAFLALGVVAAVGNEPQTAIRARGRRRQPPRPSGTGWYLALFSRPPPRSLHS